MPAAKMVSATENKNERFWIMKLIRRQIPDLWNWSPVNQLTNVRDEINRLFDSTFGDFARGTERFNGWTPALDLYEDKDNLIVKAELPGMKREEIEISVQDGTLVISGERKYEETSKNSEPYRSERFFGRFHRTVALPKPVLSDKAKATYKDGILTVVLPKTEEAKPKHIDVKVD
jgi:HSP20 family protein